MSIESKNTNNFNMESILNNIEQVKARKAKAEKKPTVSLKPLTFEINPDASPLKAEIIRRINAKNLTFSDLYDYCTALKDGDSVEGQRFGYNLISGLRHRNTMNDTTLAILCDFLKIDIYLVDKEPNTEEDNSDNNED